jgi:hypothetical protein
VERGVSRRPRIPGTPGRKTLYVLPEIRDDDPVELKNALAIRNACATEGRCPGCGVVGVVYPDAEHEGLWHYTFRHENWCRALTDDAA